MEEINKYKVTTSMVRGFFEGFFSGLIDSKAKNAEEKKDVRFVKQLVAEYYESVSSHFVTVQFPLLLAIGFADYETAVADMQKRHFSDSTPSKLLLRYACRTKEIYDSMIGEYKNQMTTLLLGHIQYPNDHLRALPSHEDQLLLSNNQCVDTDHAIRAVVRSILHGYALGIKSSNTGKTSFHQATVLRMMINGMTTLLHDTPFDVWVDAEKIGLDGVYRRVTVDARNYETLINEMNQAYEDVAMAEGIQSQDDSTEE